MKGTLAISLLWLLSFNAGAETAEATRQRVTKLEYWSFCTQLGKQLRAPTTKQNPAELKAFRDVARFDYGVDPIDFVNIMDRKLRLGMSACAVTAAIGKPQSENRTTSAAGERRQWIYSSNIKYVYLQDGSVTAWQD